MYTSYFFGSSAVSDVYPYLLGSLEVLGVELYHTSIFFPVISGIRCVSLSLGVISGIRCISVLWGGGGGGHQ